MKAAAPAVPQSEQRRRGILEAVLRIVAEGGVDAVTHRRVAAEAGVPLGSTTYWFRSRDELLLEAFRFYVAANTAMYADLERSGGSDTVDSLARLLASATQKQFDDAATLLAEYELVLFAARNPEFAKEYRAWQRTMAVHLTERLERLGASRPLAAARTVMAAMRGFELDRLASDETTADDLFGRVRALLTGLLATGGAGEGGDAGIAGNAGNVGEEQGAAAARPPRVAKPPAPPKAAAPRVPKHRAAASRSAKKP